MRRSAWLLGLVAGCRIGFDPVGGGADGTSVVSPVAGATEVVPAALAMTREGDVLIAGSADRGAGFDWAVARLDAAGRLDPAFGVDGVAMIDLGSAEDLATGIAIGPDDEILIVGETHTGTGNDHDSAVARLTPDGVLDPTFGAGGVRIWPVSSQHTRDDRARAVVVDPGGRVIIAGYTNTGYPGWEDTYVARLAADGSPDPSFGTGGIVISDAPVASGAGSANDFPRALGLDSAGRIVVGLTCSMDACVARFTADGAPDPMFGALGVASFDLGAPGSRDEAFDIAVQPDDRVLVAGATATGTGARAAVVARLTTGGELDPTFGTAGTVTLDLAPGDDQATRLAVGRDGAILVAGTAHTGTVDGLLIARLSASGIRDEAYGGAYVLDGGGAVAGDLVFDERGHACLLAGAAAHHVVVRHDPRLPWPTARLPITATLPFRPPAAGAPDRALVDGEGIDGATLSLATPLTAGALSVIGTVRSLGAPALFISARALTFAPGATLSVDGEGGGVSAVAGVGGSGGNGASGGGSGSFGYSGYASFGGRFGRAGGALEGVGGRGFAQAYARGFFYGRGGDGGRGRGCCPPSVPGGEAGNGGGGGGGGAWTNVDTGGGGGGGGLLVVVADTITGAGHLRARGGQGQRVNGTGSGGGGGGVVWIAARSYDGALTVDVTGGDTAVEERGQAGTARMFQILADDSLVERAFTDAW